MRINLQELSRLVDLTLAYPMTNQIQKILGFLAVINLTCLGNGEAGSSELEALKAQISLLNQQVVELEQLVQKKADSYRLPSRGRIVGGAVRPRSDLQMKGYLEVQYNDNLTQETSNVDGNPARFFDDNQDTFTLNAAALSFLKEANPEGGAGFHMDMVMGTNAQAMNEITLGADTDADNFNLQQAFVEFVLPWKWGEGNAVLPDSIKVILGRFVTLAGFESLEAPPNWNISRSFLFTFAEPGTHVGIRTNFGLLNDFFDVFLGLNNGWDNLIDNNSWKTLESGLSFEPLQDVTFVSAAYFGPENDRQSGHKRFLLAQTVQWDATDRLTLVAAMDYGTERRTVLDSESEVLDFHNAQWYGYVAYARYQFTDQFAVAYRVEWFRDDDLFLTDTTTLWEQTVTAEYQWNENVISRFEFRYDKDNDGNMFNGESHQATIGAQLVYII